MFRILLVDDDVEMLMLLDLQTRSLNVEIHYLPFTASLESILRIRPRYYDLILTDIFGTSIDFTPLELTRISTTLNNQNFYLTSSVAPPKTYGFKFVIKDDLKVLIGNEVRKKDAS